jgi:hypothetical protein
MRVSATEDLADKAMEPKTISAATNALPPKIGFI